MLTKVIAPVALPASSASALVWESLQPLQEIWKKKNYQVKQIKNVQLVYVRHLQVSFLWLWQFDRLFESFQKQPWPSPWRIWKHHACRVVRMRWQLPLHPDQLQQEGWVLLSFLHWNTEAVIRNDTKMENAKKLTTYGRSRSVWINWCRNWKHEW